MELGFIGLGKMGSNMTRRLVAAGHHVLGFDVDDTHRREAATGGVVAVDSVAALVERLAPPRAVWLMLPHGAPTAQTISALLQSLVPEDVLVDGGNSHYTDSQAAAARCAARGVRFLDAGVSGGVGGLKDGYCLMVGGAAAACARLEPVFTALAPPGGYAHVGPSGAGHFVKMVHNAIEYAVLASLGEGFECLERAELDLDLGQIAELWRHGSVIRSWLLDLLAATFKSEGNGLERIGAYVDDSGTGRWSVAYALERAIPIPVITQALYERFDSRLDERFSAKVIAALRLQFGGHAVRRASE
jgi:6-phosphogluconate dehydrogenase